MPGDASRRGESLASFNGNRHGRLDNRNRTDSNQDAASAGWWKPICAGAALLGRCQPDSRTGDLIRCRRRLYLHASAATSNK